MNKLYKNIFLYGINLTYILYFCTIIGLTSFAPQYLTYLKFILKIYVAIILIVLYNPITYKEKSLTDF